MLVVVTTVVIMVVCRPVALAYCEAERDDIFGQGDKSRELVVRLVRRVLDLGDDPLDRVDL